MKPSLVLLLLCICIGCNNDPGRRDKEIYGLKLLTKDAIQTAQRAVRIAENYRDDMIVKNIELAAWRYAALKCNPKTTVGFNSTVDDYALSLDTTFISGPQPKEQGR